mmetsp:Transcript_19626/g.21833  ORF Transcript_19626/g.21833 Transcript_19626/m.21833 type:complete len:106 (-) Transcript_19626:165-482(-)|eukprot:CAMPEP_0168508832 /NCGR_PEP_ID=MMETSP0405-20121227/371_1 /TAXON_ID=498012 /ORGANISM="Trichosphaerium sp, Strain Am-I-7 wt" /LENGTH=105 /DNA_ID=CAMNT_0008526087 /DNA_START=43 /DNA_END=360 /DNA_ORIENTATION=+
MNDLWLKYKTLAEAGIEFEAETTQDPKELKLTLSVQNSAVGSPGEDIIQAWFKVGKDEPLKMAKELLSNLELPHGYAEAISHKITTAVPMDTIQIAPEAAACVSA